jgi:hypothetical protein
MTRERERDEPRHAEHWADAKSRLRATAAGKTSTGERNWGQRGNHPAAVTRKKTAARR